METMELVANTVTTEDSMSSRELAGLLNTPHNDLLKKLRKLEEPYIQAFGTEGKFSLSEYVDSTGRRLPEYRLTKSQSLFIASRYKPELHAMVQKRWEELETERLNQSRVQPEPVVPLLPTTIAKHSFLDMAEMFEAMGVHKSYAIAEAAKIAEDQSGLSFGNILDHSIHMDAIPDEVVMLEPTELGKMLGLSAKAMNKKLAALGLQEKTSNGWRPTKLGEPWSAKHMWKRGSKTGYNWKWNMEKIKALLDD